jgi:hypothetical protein
MISKIRAVIVLGLGAASMAGMASIAPASASIVTYNFSAPGFWSGTISLDVTGGVATSGTGTLDVPGYAPQELVLITPSAPGYENPPGYRANDGTDWFGINQNVPIDSDGLLFDVGTSRPLRSQPPRRNREPGRCCLWDSGASPSWGTGTHASEASRPSRPEPRHSTKKGRSAALFALIDARGGRSIGPARPSACI